VWTRRSLATFEDRSSILRAGDNNVHDCSLLVTRPKSDWPSYTGGISVLLCSLVSASADRDFKRGSKYLGYNTA